MHLSPALSKLLGAHPKLVVEIDDSRVLPDLLAQRYDVAFVKTASQLPDSSLVSKRGVAVELAFYGAPSLIDTHGTPGAPADLGAWPAIADAEDQFWECFADGRKVARIAMQPRVRTSNAEVRIRAAIDGIGVARLPPQLCGAQCRTWQAGTPAARRRVVTNEGLCRNARAPAGATKGACLTRGHRGRRLTGG